MCASRLLLCSYIEKVFFYLLNDYGPFLFKKLEDLARRILYCKLLWKVTSSASDFASSFVVDSLGGYMVSSQLFDLHGASSL